MATALITGGTSGIGAAFAAVLATRGFDLVLVARNDDGLAASAAELRAHGVAVETIRADLADRADVDRLVARIEDPDDPIDVLVNNAGSGVYASLTDRDTTAHEQGFAVMCLAVMLLGGAAGRAMSARGSGTIINISSLQSLFTTGSYSAMKAWVTSYSQGLAVELGGTGVTVTAVLPGWVSTQWHTRAGVGTGSIPAWLWLDPRDVARTALSDAGRGRVLSTPTLRYQVIGWLARHLPRATVRWISGRLSSRKRRPTRTTLPGTPASTTGDQR